MTGEKEMRCQQCLGTGRICPDTKSLPARKCPSCRGRGFINKENRRDLVAIQNGASCNQAVGLGNRGKERT